MIIETLLDKTPPNSAVIGLHGYTGDEHVLKPVIIGIKSHHTKWFIPRAPYKNLNGQGNTWFTGNDSDGWKFQDSFDLLNELLTQILSEGFPKEKIFILGFSQGACLAMDFMVRMSFPIGGIIPIAGFIKYSERFKHDATNQSKNTPVHLFHGEKDHIVPFNESENSMELFSSLGYDVSLTPYKAKHKISTRIMQSIRFILEKE
ncbi:MAG: dienelactone hydrolase family protein [Candidatus Marinimicrobia bacterium]|nr:dienelactone hydrolase family protein [Candidatus Neomarinimicrobiota bacterium]